jgi:hypothetical protein
MYMDLGSTLGLKCERGSVQALGNETSVRTMVLHRIGDACGINIGSHN